MGEYQVHLDAAPGLAGRLRLSGTTGVPRAGPGSARGAERGIDRDSAEISSAALQLSRRREVRQELVDRVRQEIADGTYVTPDRTDAAAEALMQTLLGR